MGTDNQARALINGLADADIMRVSAVPGLGPSWAKIANTAHEDLVRGVVRALRAVRTAMLRDWRSFADTFDQFWELEVLDALEADDSGDRAAYAARLAARALGSPAAKALLACIAESSRDLAAEIEARFDELCELTENPLPPDPLVTDSCSQEGSEQPINVQRVSELIDQTRVLRDEGEHLSARLRAAAEAIGSGRPAEALEGAADLWSAAVRAHLSATAHMAEASDLVVLEKRLSSLAEEHATRSAKAGEALKTVRLLSGQGLDMMVPEALDRLGFTSVEEVERLVSASAPAGEPALQEAEDAAESATFADTDSSTQSAAPNESQKCANQTAGAAPDSGPPIDLEAATSASPEPTTSATPSFDAGNGLERATDAHPVTMGRQGPADEPVDLSGPDSSVLASDTADEADVLKQVGEALDQAPPLPDYPWDEGKPPLIADLIGHGRYALVCHVAAATGEAQPRQRLLRLACAAARCSTDALEIALPRLVPSESDIAHFGIDEVRVLLAGSLRAGLRLGYAPLGISSLVDRAELADTGYAAVIQALAVAVQRGRGRRVDQSARNSEQLTSRWAELGHEAERLGEELKHKNLKYQRSSKVLHHLVKSSQPVGKALTDAAALVARGIDGASVAGWTEIESLADDLTDHNKRERLINAAEQQVSSGPQLRNPITAGARTQLHEKLEKVGDLFGRLLSVRRAILSADDFGDMESAQDLDRALAEAPAATVTPTVGDAALINLIDSVRNDAVDQLANSVDDVLERELLAVFEMPRDAECHPARKATAAEVALLLTTRDADIVIAGHLEKGDIAAAREFIADRGLEESGFDDTILRASREAELRHDRALADAEIGAAKLRSLNKEDLARDLSAKIDTLRTPRQDRFDLTIDELQKVTARAEDELAAVRLELRERTLASSASETSKARILDRLECGDELLAVEFLTVAEAGKTLPEAVASTGDDFGDFFPSTVNVAADAQDEGGDALIAAQEALCAPAQPTDRQLKDGLAAWKSIKKSRRGDRDNFPVQMAELLRMVGLVPRSTNWHKEISKTQRAGFATFRVTASPVDRSYVPQLGTQAQSSYYITFVWDRATPSRLLDFIDERRANLPNIIFYFGALSAGERVQLRNLTLPGRKGFSPLVIDDAVIAWLSSRQEPGWRFTQRVTLPFTTINPYTPFAGGEVPDEVFVGRDEERVRIESPTGSMFVYGGRQLGKSALLRRVERLFNESSPDQDPSTGRTGNVAVYIDLKAAGIGEALEPAALWPLLADRLTAAGVIAEKSGPTSTADEVKAHIKRWLDSEPANRMLALLDEADNFLTVDAGGGAAARGAFPVLQALKGLMQSSKRRFKVVFAGLHQVQRFYDTSNTPVAHGGEDILIGPLNSSAAYSLVVDPMNALGYEFANPELVWRLLLVTNYQASLVQIVCDALVRHLRTRQLTVDGHRIIIRDKDVQHVCADPGVRDLIAQRFRWTINLDSRYRVIALVVAVRSLDAKEPGSTFSIDDLRDDCETYWQVGFSRDLLSRKEFERYLVEMVGLGVLHRQGERFGLRSPNIVGMLGSPESLEQELQDAHLHLEPAFEYNPTMTRQIIGDSTQSWSPRSPLTDHDLARLIADDPDNRVQVVFGSHALGVDRVAAVIAKSASANEVRFLTCDRVGLAGLAQRRFSKRTHVVVDLSSDSSTTNLADVVQTVTARSNLTATIVVGPNLLAAVQQLEIPVHHLRRWSMDGLRAWDYSPFDSPALRKRLFRVTSGWPKLVEIAMKSVADGQSPDGALTELVRYLAEPKVKSELIAQSAIDHTIGKRWATWFSSTGDDGLVESDPASVADLAEALGRDAVPVLEELEALDLVTQAEDGWVLDRVILSAAAQSAT